MPGPRPLTPLESAFLHIEGDRTPMHLGSVGIFEAGPLRDGHGRLRLDELRAHVGGRLDAVPKLRCRIRSAVLPGAPPLWIDHPGFDVAQHVEAIDLGNPCSLPRLWTLCGELFARPLDRSRPLWHLAVVDGLPGDRLAVIERVHHSVTDGLGGVEIATALFDLEPRPPAPARGIRTSAPWEPRAAPGPVSGVVGDLGRLGAMAWRWADRGRRAVAHPWGTAGGTVALGRAVATLVGTGLVRPPTSLNRTIGPGRRALVERRPLEELHEAARVHGVTVNDVVLTAVGAGVGRLLAGRGERAPRDVHVLVPVGLSPGDRPELGNLVSAWLVRVPIGAGAPLDRLKAVAASTGRARSEHEELATEAVLDVPAPLPQPVVACAGALANHQPMVNLVVTNVPGPPVPLYLMGARMVEAYPFVPLAGNLTLGVAVLSYDGALTLGVLVDPATCPDAEAFVLGVDQDLDALVGSTVRRPPRVTRRGA
ncbi:MAG: wax ester/triacylglycerol synthase family O-acyltransferase [Acidimicrobiales bacterium]